jgi:hypothetical protein
LANQNFETIDNTEKLNPEGLDRAASADAEAGSFAKSMMDQVGSSLGRAVGDVGKALQFHAEQAQKAKDTQATLDLTTQSMNFNLQHSDQLDKLVASNPQDPQAARASYTDGVRSDWQTYYDQAQQGGASPETLEKIATHMETAVGEASRSSAAEFANLNVANMHSKVGAVMDAATVAIGNHPFDDQANAHVRDTVNEGINSAFGTDPSAKMIIKADGSTESHETALTRAQFEGALQVPGGPQKLQTKLLAGDYDKLPGMTETLKAEYADKAATAIRTQDAAQKAEVEVQTKAQKTASEGAATSLIMGTVDPATGVTSIGADFFKKAQAYGAMPGVTADEAENVVKWGEAIKDGKLDHVVDDKATRDQLQAQANDHTLTANTVIQATLDGKLSKNSSELFVKLAKPAEAGGLTQDDRDAMAQANKDYTPHMALDANSSDITKAYGTDQEYQTWLGAALNRGFKAGHTAYEMLQDPTSPFYLRNKPDANGKIANPSTTFDPSQVDLTKQPIMFPPGVKAPAASGPQQAAPIQQDKVDSIMFGGGQSNNDTVTPKATPVATPKPTNTSFEMPADAPTIAGYHAHFNRMNTEEFGDPHEAGWEAANITTIKAGDQDVRVNKQAAPHFEGFLKDLAASGYKLDNVSGYVLRDKRGGSGLSQHAWGNAIDINPKQNPMTANGQVVTNLPSQIRTIAAKWGLSWGADFRGQRKDSMHFEWTGSPQTGKTFEEASL